MKTKYILIAFVLCTMAAAGCTFILPFPDDLGGGDGSEDGMDAPVESMGDGEEDGVPGTCGNGELDEGEECDDGANGNPHDGCRDDCRYSCHDNDDCSLPENCWTGGTCNMDTPMIPTVF